MKNNESLLKTVIDKVIYRVATGEWPEDEILMIRGYNSPDVGFTTVMYMENGDQVNVNITGTTIIKYEAPTEIDLLDDEWSIE